MTMMDSFVQSFIGLIVILIVSAFIVGIWPSLVLYLGNSSVFGLGSVTLMIISFIPLILVVALIKGILEAADDQAQKIRGLIPGQV